MQVVAVTGQALQTAGAAGQDFDVARRVARDGSQGGFVFANFFFLAKTHLGGNVWARHAQGAGLTTTTVALEHGVAHQGLDRFHRVLLFHRAVTRVVVQVGPLLAGVERDVLLQQVLVDINDAASREDFVELVALQLVVTGATAHHHRLDVEVVERVGHTVKQHAVVGDDFFSLVKLPAATLRVTAT